MPPCSVSYKATGSSQSPPRMSVMLWLASHQVWFQCPQHVGPPEVQTSLCSLWLPRGWWTISSSLGCMHSTRCSDSTAREAADLVPCQRMFACQATGSHGGRRWEERRTSSTNWVYLPAEYQSRLTDVWPQKLKLVPFRGYEAWLWHTKNPRNRYLEPSHSTVQCYVVQLTGFSKRGGLCSISPSKNFKERPKETQILISWIKESQRVFTKHRDSCQDQAGSVAALQLLAACPQQPAAGEVPCTGRQTQAPSEKCPQTGDTPPS